MTEWSLVFPRRPRGKRFAIARQGDQRGEKRLQHPREVKKKKFYRVQGLRSGVGEKKRVRG